MSLVPIPILPPILKGLDENGWKGETLPAGKIELVSREKVSCEGKWGPMTKWWRRGGTAANYPTGTQVKAEPGKRKKRGQILRNQCAPPVREERLIGENLKDKINIVLSLVNYQGIFLK